MDVVRAHSPVSPKLLRSVVVALLVSALVATGALAARQARANGSAPLVERSAIVIDRVREGDLLRQVPVHGTLVPEHVRWLSATSAGQVAKLAVKSGAIVEPDTVVVVLANAELELAALEAERHAASAESALIQLDVRTETDSHAARASLDSLSFELADADRRKASADRLVAEGLMGALERDDARGKAGGLGARVQGERARLAVLDGGRTRQIAAQRAEIERLREIASFARRRLAALEVRAGIHGVVQDIPLEHGQWVAIGSLLAKVAEPGRLKGDVRVSESEAAEVHRGLGVRFEVAHGVTYRGKVERIDPAVAKGSVRLEVALDDATPAGARADQTISGFVEIEQLKGVVHVTRPAGALDRSTVQVFRLAPGGTARRVAVRLGRGSAREIEVLGGLVPGDDVVVSDVSVPDGTTDIRLK